MAKTKNLHKRFKMHVKKGDTVQVISGRDKGKVGEVLQAIPKSSQVLASAFDPRLLIYSEKEKVVSRICYTFTDDGRKVRMLKKTGEIID